LKKFSDAKVSHSFEAVTRFITAHKYLQNCLGELDKDGTTLLHAIARTLPHDFDEWKELFSRLLPMVQEATLGLLDELDHDILMYKYSEGNTLLHLVSQYNYVFQEPSCGLDTHGIQLELAKDLVRRCPKLLKVTNNAGHSAYLHRIHTFSTNHLNEKYQESGIGWAVHDNITQYLMNEYMHLDDRDEIITFLQGSIQGKKTLTFPEHF